MQNTSREGRFVQAFGVALAVFVVDQALKRSVGALLQSAESVVLLPGVLDLTYIGNPGGAFGLFGGRSLLLLFASLLAVAAVYWVLATGKSSRTLMAGAGLIIGGTASNLLDRVVARQVTDYLRLSVFPYIFNVADVAIIVGAGLLLAGLLSRRS